MRARTCGALAAALVLGAVVSLIACDTPPEPMPPSAAFVMPSAHPSPDPPPARPLSIEAHDAAADADVRPDADAAAPAPFQLPH